MLHVAASKWSVFNDGSTNSSGWSADTTLVVFAAEGFSFYNLQKTIRSFQTLATKRPFEPCLILNLQGIKWDSKGPLWSSMELTLAAQNDCQLGFGQRRCTWQMWTCQHVPRKKGTTPTTKYFEHFWGVAQKWWITFDSICCHLNLVISGEKWSNMG